MASDKTTQNAFKIGRAKADEVIAFRTKALKRRSKALAKHAAKLSVQPESPQPVVILPKALAATAASAGVLVAEGDSWFDYPWTDVLKVLEDDHGYDVESVAHKGDRVEEMAYSGGQLEELSRRIEKLLRNNKIPKAILLSGGGNDIAGAEFGMLLNHAASAIAGLNDQVVSGVIDQRIRTAYITILAAITQLCVKWLQRPLPILVHGYDYAVPDGRGFLGGWAFLPGPWLQPGFREKGFDNIDDCKALVKKLMDRFNAMLADVCGQPEFKHVKYVNIRNTLSTAANYKQFWANELHPTGKGFGLVTDRFVTALGSL
jgi:hypothetical protein